MIMAMWRNGLPLTYKLLPKLIIFRGLILPCDHRNASDIMENCSQITLSPSLFKLIDYKKNGLRSLSQAEAVFKTIKID